MSDTKTVADVKHALLASGYGSPDDILAVLTDAGYAVTYDNVVVVHPKALYPVGARVRCVSTYAFGNAESAPALNQVCVVAPNPYGENAGSIGLKGFGGEWTANYFELLPVQTLEERVAELESKLEDHITNPSAWNVMIARRVSALDRLPATVEGYMNRQASGR